MGSVPTEGNFFILLFSVNANAGRILLGFGRKWRIIEKLEWSVTHDYLHFVTEHMAVTSMLERTK